jgi:thioredoxin reductase (NADPH)
MPVFTASECAAPLAAGAGDARRLVVVSLCAAWCDTCTQFRAAYERIAAARPQMTFVWLDIEDDASICGDIDVENFPTLAVFRGASPVHFGVSLPHEATVARLVDALSDGDAHCADAPDAVRALRAALAAPRR